MTNLWKFKWRGRESNLRPLAPQAKELNHSATAASNIGLVVKEELIAEYCKKSIEEVQVRKKLMYEYLAYRRGQVHL